MGGSSNFGIKAIGQTKYEPIKLQLLNLGDAKIKSVSFGQRYLGIISESKEEEKEGEVLLKGGEERSVENDMNDVENTKVQHVFVQNPKLFGDDGWIPIESKTKYVFFPYFGNSFLENLVPNEEKQVVELTKHAEIDRIYHSDILEAQFFQSTDDSRKKVINGMAQKQKFMLKSKKFTFSKIEEISFKFPKKQTDFNEYVRPKKAKSIYLLFMFKGGKDCRVYID